MVDNGLTQFRRKTEPNLEPTTKAKWKRKHTEDAFHDWRHFFFFKKWATIHWYYSKRKKPPQRKSNEELNIKKAKKSIYTIGLLQKRYDNKAYIVEFLKHIIHEPWKRCQKQDSFRETIATLTHTQNIYSNEQGTHNYSINWKWKKDGTTIRNAGCTSYTVKTLSLWFMVNRHIIGFVR